MTEKSPMATPLPWDLVCEGYVAELLDQFTNFARDALRISEMPDGADVLDVAAGPGSLSLLAAERARRVTAVDFSSQMLAELRRRAERAQFSNITAIEADGQALPFPDGSFDRAYSQFGLIFFPDRAAGFRELLRVLRPGGRATVSSWAPLEMVPALAALFAGLRELMPELPFGTSKAPLANREDFAEEMRAAGFDDVRVETSSHAYPPASTAEVYASMERSSAPLVLLRSKLGEARWAELSRGLLARLEQELGPGPLTVELFAYVGVGTRPSA